MKHPLYVACILLANLLLPGASAQPLTSAEFVWAPQFKVGDRFPDASLTDHTGQPVDLAELTGERGYLIAFNRSVVW